MNGFLNFLLHLIFIATFVFLYVVSVIILRPFRVHRKRPVSTIALKTSYLLYLVVFLVLAYMVLFHAGTPPETEDPGADRYLNVYYAVVITAFFVPNLAIMIRRKIGHFRTQYNIIFSIVNILISLSLAYIIFSLNWEF